jgi:hypothetical protein
VIEFYHLAVGPVNQPYTSIGLALPDSYYVTGLEMRFPGRNSLYGDLT